MAGWNMFSVHENSPLYISQVTWAREGRQIPLAALQQALEKGTVPHRCPLHWSVQAAIGSKVQSWTLLQQHFCTYKLGLTASHVVRLVGLLLVFASQKIVQNVRDEMAEFVLLLRKKIKDSLIRLSMQQIALQDSFNTEPLVG